MEATKTKEEGNAVVAAKDLLQEVETLQRKAGPY